MGDQILRWHACPSLAELQKEAAARILQNAADAVSERGVFRIVLAGGSTPKALYERLRLENAQWDAWEIYFGDERCLPPRHPERNSRMASDAWLSHVPIRKINIIPAELGAEEGAMRYSEILQDIGAFDLVLLGLGEDGHTASLFPGKPWNSRDVVAVPDAPKPPPQRVSLSAQRLSLARNVLFLVSGESKRKAISDWKSGQPIPASFITPPSGIDILIESFLTE